MKLPLWAKNHEGSWELFPYHLLDTFEDGRQGFVFQGFVFTVYDDEKRKAFMTFRKYFELNPRDFMSVKLLRLRYNLKEGP